MDRYQVRAGHKEWGDPGPDLLRTRANAVEQVRQILPEGRTWSWRKRRANGRWSEIREVGDEPAVASFLGDALPTLSDGQVLQIGDGEPFKEAAIARGCAVPVPDLSSASPLAETAHAIVQYVFPDSRFTGSFACKQEGRHPGDPIVVGLDWSDHAFGDAVDHSPDEDGKPSNDELFDWTHRMLREDLLPGAFLIEIPERCGRHKHSGERMEGGAARDRFTQDAQPPVSRGPCRRPTTLLRVASDPSSRLRRGQAMCDASRSTVTSLVFERPDQRAFEASGRGGARIVRRSMPWSAPIMPLEASDCCGRYPPQTCGRSTRRAANRVVRGF